MKLSEQPEYRIAIPAAAIGDYATARTNLETLVARAEAQGDETIAGYLLQKLGNVEASAGNFELGHALHKRAIDLDPSSPSPVLLYARGLAREFRQPAQALAHLATVEAWVSSPNWTPQEDEFGREWYMHECQELRASILRAEP
jgi:hypothetical protein